MKLNKWKNSYEILEGNALATLKTLPDESVHTFITSIPYWAMRVYDIKPQVWEENPDFFYCDHDFSGADPIKGMFCMEGCGSWFGSLGLEPTLALFIHHIVLIFREVKRVLRKDGTLWLNIGDCYGQGGNRATKQDQLDDKRRAQEKGYPTAAFAATSKGWDRAANTVGNGIKAKDLIGQPWEVAFALRADGWFLRSDIIWAKNNSLPESVQDRPSKQHEYIFLLAKSKRYYYDRFAIQEPIREDTAKRQFRAVSSKQKYHEGAPGQTRHSFHQARPNRTNSHNVKDPDLVPSKRNKRTVWSIPTNSFKGAHFATFPLALPSTCLLAATSEKGCCVDCGAPFERITRASKAYARYLGKGYNDHSQDLVKGFAQTTIKSITSEYITIGWRPTCKHYQKFYDALPLARNARKRNQQIASKTRANRLKRAPLLGDYQVKPSVVCDPFMGSGTTALAALIHGRDALGVELSAKYIGMAHARIKDAILPSAKIIKLPKKQIKNFDQLSLWPEEEAI